jgi:hypothetical protein
MRFTKRVIALPLLCLGLGVWPAPSLADGSVEGRWVLVEQHYGKGKSNLAPQDQLLHMEFVVEGGRINGKVWAGHEAASAVRWPAMAVEGQAVQGRVKELYTAPDSKSVRASYTVDPSPSDDLVLEIVEEYRVVDGGKGLKGTVTVTFLRGGDRRGSYTLHRRFERQP